MKQLLILLTLFAFTINLKAETRLKQNYNFPFKNHLDATIASVFVFNKSNYEKLEIEIRKDRRDVPLLENKNKVTVGLFEQKNKLAPLVFVIPGAGSAAMADRALNMAELFYNQGFHAITLPNNLHFQYVLGVSESTLPGYMPHDAIEYYSFIQKVVSYLKEHKQLQISQYALVGYSLGGLLSAFLAEEDANKKILNFNKVILLNPAIDIGYGIEQLDYFYNQGNKMSFELKQFYAGTFFDMGIKYSYIGFIPQLLQEDLRIIKPQVKEWIIGEVFRQGLRDVIFASQQIRDLGILKNQATQFQRNARLEEAYSYSFKNYMKNFVMPQIGNNFMVFQGGLYNVHNILSTNKNIFIFTNEDDFLIQKSDLDLLSHLLGPERLTVYPYGGHSGNYWFPQNQQDLVLTLTR